MLSPTALKAIEAYGGSALWQNANKIEAEVSAKGLAFKLKRRPFFAHAKITMDVKRPFSKLTPIGKDKNISGVLDGNRVYLENPEGKILSERNNPRDYFPFGRRLFYWDDMDMAYFANYAFWNYFTFPNLLMNGGITWTETKPGFLKAIFPDTFPTHSNLQEFIIDMATGKLLQHNYTANVISKLATAANIVAEHREENGLLYPSARLVTPRSKSGKALKGPVLIDIMVHSFKLI